MITFNTILEQAGVDPDTVRLVRHQDARNPGGTTLYETWRSEPHRIEAYQQIQSRQVFAFGDIVASFVVTPPPRRETLFIGLYLVTGMGIVPEGTVDPVGGDDVGGLFRYEMKPDHRLADYAGRLTIEWGAGFRSWMQRAKQKDKLVVEIRDEIEPPFPGFTRFHWNVDELQTLYPTWKEVLRNVKGVYLLVDRESGRQYIGSATGEDSLWGRFRAYAETGHGGNVELKLLGRRPYQVTVLQVASFDQEILELERAWKAKLLSQQFGLNKN
jgi:hypothetical protein